jgi:serine/threonine protein kinase
MQLLGKRFMINDELLGFGSFGRTYLGTDTKLTRYVAIKIVRNIVELIKLIDVEKEVYGIVS